MVGLRRRWWMVGREGGSEEMEERMVSLLGRRAH